MMTNLDDAYANAAHIPGAEHYPPRWAAKAAAFREGAQGRLDVSYGAGDRQRFDLFLPDGPPTGLIVFVHGGYWLRFGRKDWSHLAAGAVSSGWACAMPSYDLAPAVRISEITQQIARAIEAAAAQINGPLVLTGHSAGGHLVARMLCPDVDLSVRDRVVRVVPISPLTDLRPLMQTTMNADLGIDADEAISESPVSHKLVGSAAIHVWVGGDERPAFLDHSRWLAEAWGAPMTVDPGKHHFDVIDGMERSDDPFMRRLLNS